VNDDSDLIEQLAERVHASWAAEKQRQGFVDHPFQRDTSHSGQPMKCAQCGGLQRIGSHPDNNHHPDMLPYADLAENVKEYDRATVRAVLDAIHQAGYLIVPNMTVPV
jgi:hypothetical protein